MEYEYDQYDLAYDVLARTLEGLRSIERRVIAIEICSEYQAKRSGHSETEVPESTDFCFYASNHLYLSWRMPMIATPAGQFSPSEFETVSRTPKRIAR